MNQKLSLEELQDIQEHTCTCDQSPNRDGDACAVCVSQSSNNEELPY